MQLQVSGAEVVGPLTAAMYLVHTHHSNLAPVLGEVLYEELLRGYEQHFDVLVLDSLDYLLLQRVRLLTV